MDIGSTHGGLAARLSNFQARQCVLEMDDEFLPDAIKTHPLFIENVIKHIDSLGIIVNSFEGVLQSLKFDKPHIAKEVCKLVGFQAKRRGSNRNKPWKTRQTLWFMGVPIDRDSDMMESIHDFIYISMWLQNEKFREDLKCTGNAVLTHSMGKSKKRDTVLTETEFCSRLMKLRSCSGIEDVRKKFKTGKLWT